MRIKKANGITKFVASDILLQMIIYFRQILFLQINHLLFFVEENIVYKENKNKVLPFYILCAQTKDTDNAVFV